MRRRPAVTNSKPRMIWQDGNYLRIVRMKKNQYVVEVNGEDALGADAWVTSKITFHDEANTPPNWVLISILEKLSRRRRRRKARGQPMKPERIEYLMSLTPDQMVEEATDAELLHLLRCARAWAELERLHTIEADALGHGGWSVRVTTIYTPHEWVTGPDLLTATEAALAKAKETTQ